MPDITSQLKNLNIVVRENEPLKNHTTFQIGGPAKIYLEISDPKKIISALKIIKEAGLNYLLLGGGSNLLVSDSGYDGVVIKIKPREIEIDGEKVLVDAGYLLAGLIMKTLDAGLTGLEFEAGVPGTVGGAIKGNAGTYGEAMEQVVEKVDFINDDLTVQAFDKKQCGFKYRHSIFKERENWLIVSAELKLAKGDTQKSRALIEERIKYRLDTQPYGYPSAGCIFKNLIYTEEIAKRLESLDLKLSPKFKEYQKIPAAFVIENLGLKGKTIGKAQVAEKHANYIINLGGATADQVVQLISLVKQKVRDKTGIQLEEEVRYLGF